MRIVVIFSVVFGLFMLGGCGGGEGDTTPPTSFIDGTTVNNVHTLKAGDYATASFTGTQTQLSNSQSISFSGTIKSELLSSTKIVNGTLTMIARNTTTLSINNGAPTVNYRDNYITQDASGNLTSWGEYDSIKATERLVTSPSNGYISTPSPVSVGTNFSYSATFSDGSTKTSSGNVTGTANVTVPYGSYSTYVVTRMISDSSMGFTCSYTSNFVPGLASSIKEVGYCSSNTYSQSISFQLTDTNIVL